MSESQSDDHPQPLQTPQSETISSFTPPNTLLIYETNSNSQSATETHSSVDHSYPSSAYFSYYSTAVSQYKVALIGFDNSSKESFTCNISDSYTRTEPSSKSILICNLPWGGSIYVSNFGRDSYVYLPSFTKLIGIANSVDDIDSVGSQIYHLPRPRTYVHFGGKTFRKIRHLAIRNSSPLQSNRCIARVVTGWNEEITFSHICESGPVIAANSDITTIPFSQLRHTSPSDLHANVIVTSRKHRVVNETELGSSVVHAIPKLHGLEEFRNLISHRRHKIHGSIVSKLQVRQPLLPWLTVFICFFVWLLPAILQWLIGEDRRLGSICNHCFMSGSILLVTLLYTVKTLFSDGFIERTMSGFVKIHNNTLARILAPGTIKKLQTVACDPRLPKNLIAQDNNSAVRVTRNGWLKLGSAIPVKDAYRHGYHILMDKGVALDLLEAKLYRMEQTYNGNERILRHGEDNVNWTAHSVRDDAMIL